MSGDREWYTVGPVVVGRYTQTRQRWLRAKIVKSGHGRHYKEALAVYRKKGERNNTITIVSTMVFLKLENQEIEKKD